MRNWIFIVNDSISFSCLIEAIEPFVKELIPNTRAPKGIKLLDIIPETREVGCGMHGQSCPKTQPSDAEYHRLYKNGTLYWVRYYRARVSIARDISV